MKRSILIVGSFIILCSLNSYTVNHFKSETDSLRALYSKPVAEWPKPDIDSGIKYEEMQALPKENAWADGMKDPEVQLGKLLFFDPRLSRSSQISCSSCHEPDLAWTDGRRVSLGNDHLQGTRNTPTLLNVFIYGGTYFWDGRANSLNSQLFGPLSAHHEMDMDTALLPAKLQAIKGYDSLFKAVYKSKVSLNNIGTALTAFEKTIRSRKSRFDLFLQGKDSAFTDQEIKGLHVFRTKARCMNCHYGTYLTDKQFHNIGLTYYKRKYEDLGRYEVTKDTADVGRFRTPSLRDVAFTGPYMHNGLFPDLEQIIQLYNSGMIIKPRPELADDRMFPKTDVIMRPLKLTLEERNALLAFLHAASNRPIHVNRPALPQ